MEIEIFFISVGCNIYTTIKKATGLKLLNLVFYSGMRDFSWFHSPLKKKNKFWHCYQ